MSIDTDVYDILVSVVDPVYPVSLPLGAGLPAVTYSRVTTQRVRSHDGTSLIGPLYQITCWDNTQTGAREVGRAVIDVFEPLIGFALIENHLETFIPEQKLFTSIVDVRVWAHEEAEAS